MATEATVVEIDRERIKELTEREEARLDERTAGSRALYERARKTLSAGVASSYQVRDPWPIYLSGRGGEGLGRRRERAARLPQRLRLDGAGPPIRRSARRSRSATRRATFRRPRTASSSRGARARWGLPRWRYTNSGSEATMDAIRIARAAKGRDTIVKIFGSYHGHHDYVMVSIGVPYEAIGDRDNYESLPWSGHPAGRRRHDHPGAVQRRAAMERRIEPDRGSRKPACVIMEAAMMNLGVVLPSPATSRPCASGQARHPSSSTR